MGVTFAVIKWRPLTRFPFSMHHGELVKIGCSACGMSIAHVVVFCKNSFTYQLMRSFDKTNAPLSEDFGVCDWAIHSLFAYCWIMLNESNATNLLSLQRYFTPAFGQGPHYVAYRCRTCDFDLCPRCYKQKLGQQWQWLGRPAASMSEEQELRDLFKQNTGQPLWFLFDFFTVYLCITSFHWSSPRSSWLQGKDKQVSLLMLFVRWFEERQDQCTWLRCSISSWRWWTTHHLDAWLNGRRWWTMECHGQRSRVGASRVTMRSIIVKNYYIDHIPHQTNCGMINNQSLLDPLVVNVKKAWRLNVQIGSKYMMESGTWWIRLDYIRYYYHIGSYHWIYKE